METTVDIEALRNDIIREVLATEDLGLLEWMKEMVLGRRRYTAKELKARIRRAEAEDEEGTDWEDVKKELRAEFPWNSW